MSIVETFFVHQITIKMFHFQTKKMANHKSADMYLANFQSNFDRFMEVWQGRAGRVKEEAIKLVFPLVDDQTIDKHLISMIKFLTDIVDISIDLSAIRDEMVEDLNQFKYLLSFE